MLLDTRRHHRETTGQSMRGLFTSVHNTIVNSYRDAREIVCGHIGNHIGGSLSGIYVRLPFTRISAFMEWREHSVGFGHNRRGSNLEVYSGRFQGVFCIEPKAW